MWHKNHNGPPSVIMPLGQQRRIGPKSNTKVQDSISN
jgi:hypothetical protein